MLRTADTISSLVALVSGGGADDSEGQLFDQDLGLVHTPVEATRRISGTESRSKTNGIDALVTGATGLIGLEIVRVLLNSSLHPEGRVVCLVRGKSDKQARERLLGLLRFGDDEIDQKTCKWRIEKSKSKKKKKVDKLCLYIFRKTNPSISAAQLVVYSCDLAEPHFGRGADFGPTLVSQYSFGSFFHSAAIVDWSLPYSKVRAVNVLGTLRMLSIASMVTNLEQERG